MKSYIVEVTECVTHAYSVDATSPEAAESIAEEWLDDGEEGNIMDREVVSTEVIEEEEEEDDCA